MTLQVINDSPGDLYSLQVEKEIVGFVITLNAL